MNTLPALRMTVEELVSHRDKSIRLYGEAWDLTREAEETARRAHVRQPPTKPEHDDRPLPGLRVKSAGELEKERADHLAALTARIDREIWEHIVLATDLERLMDATAREEFRRGLHESPPPVTVDSVRSMLENMIEDADMIFRRGVATMFSKLDRRFRSHDGFKIGSRIVLSSAFSETGGWNYYRRHDETIRDIERAFYTLAGEDLPARAASVIAKIDEERRKGGYSASQFEVEDRFFKLRGFKNGNAHLWFTDKQAVRRVNRVLADYYGEAIGESADVADTSDMGPAYHVTPARNLGFYETPPAVLARLAEMIGSVDPDCRALEPSAGRGAIAGMLVETFGVMPRCVELDQDRFAILRSRGFPAFHIDFLKYTPALAGMFDLIVMNPPFDRGRDCDHVRHALTLLKPGGRLFAVMSASAEVAEDSRRSSFRALIEKMDPGDRWDRRRWTDLPAGSFAEAGTNVNTVILTVRKPAEAAQSRAAA